MQLDFIHRFVHGESSSNPVLLLLHGTGGDENDMLDLGRSLYPGAALLSPRGKVLEDGNPRFFRRYSEGVFDEEDLIFRTHEMADFVSKAVEHYRLGGRRILPVGFSNGANLAAHLLLWRPEMLSGGVLLRALVARQPETLPNLSGKPVFLAVGRNDPFIPEDRAEHLAQTLGEAGAEVTVRWTPGGHQLTASELDEAGDWLRAL
ncbi:alpha/beta hydrolase [bacterium]|nr:alpha/beta hydrolase [bacterium]